MCNHGRAAGWQVETGTGRAGALFVFSHEAGVDLPQIKVR